jgi:hypothetical protein
VCWEESNGMDEAMKVVVMGRKKRRRMKLLIRVELS